MSTRCEFVMHPAEAVVESGAATDHVARKLRDAATDLAVVTEGDGRVVGVLTSRDLALRVCGDRLSPTGTPASEVMTREPVVCSPEDDAAQVLDLMHTNAVSHVVVTTPRRLLLGVVGIEDLVGAVEPAQLLTVVRMLGGPQARRRARSFSAEGLAGTRSEHHLS